MPEIAPPVRISSFSTPALGRFWRLGTSLETVEKRPLRRPDGVAVLSGGGALPN